MYVPVVETKTAQYVIPCEIFEKSQLLRWRSLVFWKGNFQYQKYSRIIISTIKSRNHNFKALCYIVRVRVHQNVWKSQKISSPDSSSRTISFLFVSAHRTSRHTEHAEWVHFYSCCSDLASRRYRCCCLLVLVRESQNPTSLLQGWYHVFSDTTVFCYLMRHSLKKQRPIWYVPIYLSIYLSI